MLEGANIPIITVGYRNPRDVATLLGAIAHMRPKPSFAVLVCENGGPAAFDALLLALAGDKGPCSSEAEEIALESPLLVRARRLSLKGAGAPVIGAEATENLGYAGGINVWLKIIAAEPGWEGVWIVNPDTAPEPDALVELVDWARARGKGMVGSRVMFGANAEIVASRGLKWRKWLASTRGVDLGAPASIAPDPADIEARIDAPSGASFYATRACIERIGLLDESFFLYFEDLDWGLRAKGACGVGYAYRSIVPHEGGTTIGSGRSRASSSRLAVYLGFRNRLLFVRKHYPAWYFWTVLMCAARAFEFLLVGSVQNFYSALAGLFAGLRGETGRPDHMFSN